MNDKDKDIRIFYSWQSDTDQYTNRYAIKDAIIKSIEEINKDKNLCINFDEDTRDTTGSPEIKETIFQKIRNADIFIADVSIINNSVNEIRKVPNPNVMIELGLSIERIGLERVILLFNENCGNIDDLPFDIKTNRIVKYKMIDKKDKNGECSLKREIIECIISILDKNPVKNYLSYTSDIEFIKRQKDIENFTNIIESVDFRIFENYLEELPLKLYDELHIFFESFRPRFLSSDFIFYDERIKTELLSIYNEWAELLNFTTNHYQRNSNDIYCIFINDYNSDDAYETIIKKRDKLFHAYRQLLEFLKDHYIEINIKDTNKSARNMYQKNL